MKHGKNIAYICFFVFAFFTFLFFALDLGIVTEVSTDQPGVWLSKEYTKYLYYSFYSWLVAITCMFISIYYIM